VGLDSAGGTVYGDEPTKAFTDDAETLNFLVMPCLTPKDLTD
jgi:hypothetical protein